jgi:hypothetical protein
MGLVQTQITLKNRGDVITEYITGRYALNIHHPSWKNEPSGDWHGCIWDAIKELPDKEVTYAGVGHGLNTFAVWGKYGIFDDKKTFEKRGIKTNAEHVYVANYFRAVLDMLFHALTVYETAMNLNCATEDYFDTGEQKLFIINNIKKAEGYFTEKAKANLNAWIGRELQYEEIRKKTGGIKL